MGQRYYALLKEIVALMTQSSGARYFQWQGFFIFNSFVNESLAKSNIPLAKIAGD
jgi:hypothetical protein